MRVAWDLDGTLVLTREANLAAYRQLGVEPPPDFAVRPWQDWCKKDVHDRKSENIDWHLRRRAEATPLLGMFAQLGGAILTNASPSVVRSLRAIFPELRKAQIIEGLTPEAKVRWLQTSSPGLYLDDSIRTVEMVRRETPWKSAVVSF